MRTTLSFLTPLCVLLAGTPSSVSAHYLWVTLDKSSGEHGVANIYFEEGPAAGDGHYLDHFTKTSKTHISTLQNPKPELIKPADTKDGDKRWLQAVLPVAGPRSVDCYGKFGVYSYGQTKVLLHYYARYLDVNSHDDLHELSQAEHLDLQIIPHDHEDEVELTVLWLGKPAADRTIYIRGPKKFRQNIQTDKNGRAHFSPQSAGRYVFRTSVELATPGRDGGENYELIRHHGTLIMALPLQK